MEKSKENIVIGCEREVLAYLSLPSIPLKEWDGVSSFSRGVGVLSLRVGGYAYCVCAYDADAGMVRPRIAKVFIQEPFVSLERVYIVPEYMSTLDDVEQMDLDDESKALARDLLEQADEASIVADDTLSAPEHEWYFPEITNLEEARAWLKAYNKSHRIKGSLPRSEETVKLRLASLYSELNK